MNKLERKRSFLEQLIVITKGTLIKTLAWIMYFLITIVTGYIFICFLRTDESVLELLFLAALTGFFIEFILALVAIIICFIVDRISMFIFFVDRLTYVPLTKEDFDKYGIHSYADFVSIMKTENFAFEHKKLALFVFDAEKHLSLTDVVTRDSGLALYLALKESTTNALEQFQNDVPGKEKESRAEYFASYLVTKHEYYLNEI